MNPRNEQLIPFSWEKCLLFNALLQEEILSKHSDDTTEVSARNSILALKTLTNLSNDELMSIVSKGGTDSKSIIQRSPSIKYKRKAIPSSAECLPVASQVEKLIVLEEMAIAALLVDPLSSKNIMTAPVHIKESFLLHILKSNLLLDLLETKR
jgi:hypothetical protein